MRRFALTRHAILRLGIRLAVQEVCTFKKFRNAMGTFCIMKEYGFLPTVESCNAHLSAPLSMNRVDVVFSFYPEMRRCRISPNALTLDLVMSALARRESLKRQLICFPRWRVKGCCPTVASYNMLITRHCNKGLLSSAMELKDRMKKKGFHPNVITFNALISCFCKEGKSCEANRIFSEMKASNVASSTVSYNILICRHSEASDGERGGRLFEEMSKHEVRANILTYKALILGPCKNGKTKKAAYLVKDVDSKGLVPDNRALWPYKSMIRSGRHPNSEALTMLMRTFVKCDDLDGVVQVLAEMVNRSTFPIQICCPRSAMNFAIVEKNSWQ